MTDFNCNMKHEIAQGIFDKCKNQCDSCKKKCKTPPPFQVQRTKCPDCQRGIQSIENGKKKCKKCLQFVIFENGVATKAVPKELI